MLSECEGGGGLHGYLEFVVALYECLLCLIVCYVFLDGIACFSDCEYGLLVGCGYGGGFTVGDGRCENGVRFGMVCDMEVLMVVVPSCRKIACLITVYLL